MSSDTQFTALGPTEIGFQTDGANIKSGAVIQGVEVGIRDAPMVLQYLGNLKIMWG
jgi:hypothetical protein